MGISTRTIQAIIDDHKAGHSGESPTPEQVATYIHTQRVLTPGMPPLSLQQFLEARLAKVHDLMRSLEG